MAFNMNNRQQPILFPEVIEDYVPANAPVRVYDAFVEALDFKKLDISLEPNPGGDKYYPKDILKLIIFGTSYGIRSSRKLERASHDNLSFIWLLCGLKPDYRTIARFRVKYKDSIKKVLKQCVQMCIKLDLIEGNVLFVDGSKFRANASINNSWTKEKCAKYMKKIEEQIDRLMDDIEKTDIQEQQEESLVKIKEQIHDKVNLVNRIKKVLNELETQGKETINSIDGDSVKAKSRQGTHAAHNVQSVVDGKHGLMVQAEAVSQSNDYNQLSVQVEQAAETVGKKPKHICADAGYSAINDLKKIDESINIIVPSNHQAQEENGRCPVGEFDKSHFVYDEKSDTYICPQGKQLKLSDVSESNKIRYRADGKECQACTHFKDPSEGGCTKSPEGRRIIRLSDERLKEQIEVNYKRPENQAIYKLRKQTVEHPFGHIKHNLQAGQFLLRGNSKVNAEVSILATCFNIARMITIIGITQLIANLKAI